MEDKKQINQESSLKKLLFIINPVSGTRRSKESFVNQIDKNLDTTKFSYSIAFSEFQGHATSLAKNAIENDTDGIVCVGGDGSINEVAQALIGTDKFLGIIPAGSGNGLAHHLRIPFRFSQALQTINKLKIHSIDTLEINKRVCVSIAGVGFDSLVAKKFEKSKTRGFNAYFQIILKEYLNYKPKKYELDIDDKKIKTRALFISFANSNQFGYNACIAPHAELDDGLIDVCIIQKIPIPKLIFLGNLLFLKKIDKTPYIKIIQGENINLSRKKGKRVNIDGENIKLEKSLNIRIVPSSLNIVIP